MSKVYYRRINTKQEDFVLIYSIEDVTKDKGSAYLESSEKTREITEKFEDVIAKYQDALLDSTIDRSRFEEIVKSLIEFDFDGYKVSWSTFAYYEHLMNGIATPPIEISQDHAQAHEIREYITVVDYYTSLGRTIPANKNPEDKILISKRPGQRNYLSYPEAQKSFIHEVYFSKEAQALTTIDLINTMNDEQVNVSQTQGDVNEPVNDINATPLNVESEVEATPQSANVTAERIEELTNIIEQYGLAGEYEKAAYCKMELSRLLDANNKIEIDYTSLIASLNDKLKSAEEAFDYVEIATIKTQLAVIEQAQSKEGLSYEDRVTFFQQKLEETTNDENSIVTDAWAKVLEVAQDAKKKQKL